MNEPRSQLRIIAALLVVVIALAGGLFFFMPEAEPSLPIEAKPLPPHQKVRDATTSLDPALVFTQTFGGSGAESVVETFYMGGYIYILGNTTSSDLDFDSAGAFFAKLNAYGKTCGFVTYPGELVAATLYEGGFVLAIDRDSSPVALAVNYNGEELKTAAIPTARAERALDIKYTDVGYLFITSLTWEIGEFSRLKMTTLSKDLEFTGATITNEVYSLNYVDTLDVAGKYILIASAVSGLKNMLCVGEWGKIMAYYPQEFSYTVHGFWVLNDFYYLITNETSTLLLKEDGTIINICGKTENPRISGDLTHMYISADNYLYCASDDKIVFSTICGQSSFYADNYVYTISKNDGTLIVQSFKSGNKTYKSSFKFDMTSPEIFTCEMGMFVIGNTKDKFGKTDVTLIKVDY